MIANVIPKVETNEQNESYNITPNRFGTFPVRADAMNPSRLNTIDNSLNSIKIALQRISVTSL